MKDIIIVGAGGFGRELLQWIKDINMIKSKWKIKGFIDDNLNALNGYECDYKIIGKISQWKPNKNEVFACAIADPKTKEKVTTLLKEKDAVFEKIIHPTALIGSFNKIGEGFIAYPHSGINVNTKIGDFVTLLSSGVGHDVKIGNYTTISSYCDITGHVEIGSKVFIGSHATIIPNCIIGNNVYIGAGSVVIRNVKENKKVFGNPARNFEI